MIRELEYESLYQKDVLKVKLITVNLVKSTTFDSQRKPYYLVTLRHPSFDLTPTELPYLYTDTPIEYGYNFVYRYNRKDLN